MVYVVGWSDYPAAGWAACQEQKANSKLNTQCGTIVWKEKPTAWWKVDYIVPFHHWEVVICCRSVTLLSMQFQSNTEISDVYF